MDLQRLVIIGGGFGGVTLAQRAERLLPRTVEIVVIDRDNHLVFTPMLPEVAGRSISPLHVAVPGRVCTKRTIWIEANVTGIETIQGLDLGTPPQPRTVQFGLNITL